MSGLQILYFLWASFTNCENMTKNVELVFETKTKHMLANRFQLLYPPGGLRLRILLDVSFGFFMLVGF